MIETFVLAQLRAELPLYDQPPRLYQLGDTFVGGVVLHTGRHVYRLDDRIVAAPICTIWA